VHVRAPTDDALRRTLDDLVAAGWPVADHEDGV
jgi:hypothetical protein